MVKRYGYTWSFLSVTGGGKDANGDPIAPTKTWTPFKCDVQASEGGGRYVMGANGDRIDVSYQLFTPLNEGIKKGGTIKDADGNEYSVLQAFPYGRNLEIWV